MKKMISLVLCALMAASLCLTAFAVDAPGSEGGIQPLALCLNGNHTLDYANPIIDTHDRSYIDAGTCGQLVTYSYRCRNCPYTTPPKSQGHVNGLSHDFSRGVSSYCDGYNQYLTYTCSHRCGSNQTRKSLCPRSGHGGACNWLPF